VDESAEEIPPPQAIRRVQRRRLLAIGRDELERAVRPVLVVMPGGRRGRARDAGGRG
jgi:hypothetical protein